MRSAAPAPASLLPPRSQGPLEGHVRIKGPRACNALAGAGPGAGSRGSSPMSTNCELLGSGSRPALPNAGPTQAPSWPHAWLRPRSSPEPQPCVAKSWLRSRPCLAAREAAAGQEKASGSFPGSQAPMSQALFPGLTVLQVTCWVAPIPPDVTCQEAGGCVPCGWDPGEDGPYGAGSPPSGCHLLPGESPQMLTSLDMWRPAVGSGREGVGKGVRNGGGP